jgi:phosphoglycolate phosphatase-like HAD superfamily hydrolase
MTSASGDSPNLEADYAPTVRDVGPTRFLPGTGIEIIREPAHRGRYRHVLFDFDGTLSLIREGWPDVMIPMMVDVLAETPRAEPAPDLHALVEDFVMRLNGKQTIYQMIRLAEEVARRGGTPLEPLRYKAMYHERLMDRIRHRREWLRRHPDRRAEMLVPGSLDILGALRERGLGLYVASGTDEHYVREEVDLLGLGEYVGDRVYGAVADHERFSKKQVIEGILRENEVSGAELLAFGDGYVEIENTRSIGGTAVAVASDEAGRSGRPDLWKRDRLVGVGADLVIPDYRDHRALLAYLFPKDRRD